MNQKTTGSVHALLHPESNEPTDRYKMCPEVKEAKKVKGVVVI
jgi:hypothetical protein